MVIPPKLVRHLVDCYYMFVLILGSEAFGSIIKGGSASGGGAATSPVYTILWGIVYVISLKNVLRRREEVKPLLRANKAICFMLALIGASYYWSIDRGPTLHGTLTLLLTTVFAIDFSFRYTMKRQLNMISHALIFLMVASVIAELILPGFVPVEKAEATNAWHGVFEFKNNFGRIICLGTVACLSSSRRSIPLRWFIFICGVGLAILSRAMSFVGYTVMMSVVLVGWSILKWRPRPRLVGILLVSVFTTSAVIYVASNVVKITGMMDKDPHMTGRVPLWQWSIVYIEKRPLLGYGAGAFWGEDSQPARRIREAVNWDEAPHAHDAYIDTGLSLGITGLVAYFTMYLVVFARSFRYFMEGPEDYRRWPITYLVFVFLYQLTESGIVGGGNILWILFCSIAFSLTLRQQQAVEYESPTLIATAA